MQTRNSYNNDIVYTAVITYSYRLRKRELFARTQTSSVPDTFYSQDLFLKSRCVDDAHHLYDK